MNVESKSSILELWQVFAITPLEKSEALRMMTSLAYALEDLHAKGDLWDHCEKGVEILEDGNIKIHGTVSSRTQRLNGLEVDPYRSIAPPEFITSGVHDERSDIFAWGVISYELVTGECPIKGETIPELLEAATKCSFPAPDTIITGWPERLSNVIMKALSRDPKERYQNILELKKEI